MSATRACFISASSVPIAHQPPNILTALRARLSHLPYAGSIVFVRRALCLCPDLCNGHVLHRFLFLDLPRDFPYPPTRRTGGSLARHDDAQYDKRPSPIDALVDPHTFPLGMSGIIEITTFTRGLLAVRKGARESEMGFFEFVQKGPDPMGTHYRLPAPRPVTIVQVLPLLWRTALLYSALVLPSHVWV